MKPFNWRCPHCNRDVTIAGDRFSASTHTNVIENSRGRHSLYSSFIVCPNPKCMRYALTVILYESFYAQGSEYMGKLIREWSLVPPSNAKTFPDYIPKQIIDDYDEACLIKDLSPKASATLSRRCLQGIIRDYWEVGPGRLVDEIDTIKDKVDPQTWGAIDGVRKIGNIGAHMEADINMIVDVEPKEAALLINLIETLLKDWYVAREDRKATLSEIINIAENKDKQRKNEPDTEK